MLLKLRFYQPFSLHTLTAHFNKFKFFLFTRSSSFEKLIYMTEAGKKMLQAHRIEPQKITSFLKSAFIQFIQVPSSFSQTFFLTSFISNYHENIIL